MLLRMWFRAAMEAVYPLVSVPRRVDVVAVAALAPLDLLARAMASGGATEVVVLDRIRDGHWRGGPLHTAAVALRPSVVWGGRPSWVRSVPPLTWTGGAQAILA